MSGLHEQPTPEDIAIVAISEFWERIYGNLYSIPTERKAKIYQHARKAAVASARKCLPPQRTNNLIK